MSQRLKRLNLKQLKDELNKLPDEVLSHFSITHSGMTENPEAKFSLIFTAEEEGSDEWDKCLNFLNNASMKKIDKHLITYLNKDLKDMKDEDGFDKKIEDGKYEEVDWDY